MRKIISICISGLLLSACSDWLDVTPKDSIIEEDLYKEATGFHNALNGVYEQLSSKALYGQEMTWGLVDAIGQVYQLYGEDYEYYGIKNYHYYYQAGRLQYTANEDIKGAFENIWEQGYKTIANCNNIIKNVENLETSQWRYGELERNMVKGEALAARAMLHFDLLRLFAPAPQFADDRLYLPYVEEFPYYGGQTPLNVQDAMAKIEKDLLTAKDLVMAYDTSDDIHRQLLGLYYRFSTPQTVSSVPDGSEIDMNAFYFFRGYRLNAFAIEAILARIYSWWGGEKLSLAAECARHVRDFESNEGSTAFGYTGRNLNYDRKFRGDLICCISYPLLQSDYAEEYVSTSGNAYLAIGLYDKVWNDDLLDGDDYRKKLIEANGWYGNAPLKNVRSSGDHNIITETEDMVPIIRLSEMDLIEAEYYASIGNFSKAAEMITAVRVGRNCDGSVDLGITDMTSFKARLLSEVRREYFQEGQTFFFYKKYNEPLRKNMSEEDFVIPIPESENIY